MWHTVSKLANEETKSLGVTVTPLYLASLVQLVFDQLINVGEDLQAFAKHGKRKTIIPEDMYMIARKNKQLTDILKALAKENGAGISTAKEHTLGKSAAAAQNLDNQTTSPPEPTARLDQDEFNDAFDDDFDEELDFEEIENSGQRSSKRG